LGASFQFFTFSLISIRPPPPPTLFPYTTLFRSQAQLLNVSIAFDKFPYRVTNAGGKVHARSGFLDIDAYATAGRQRITCQAKLRSEEHTSELQSRENLVCRLLLEKKKKTNKHIL